MSFEINKPTIKVEDTIHYLVTRPIAPVVDDDVAAIGTCSDDDKAYNISMEH